MPLAEEERGEPVRGDGVHSFGHGPTCYWCGVDGDDPEIEKPCDEREHQKPSEASMKHYECVSAIEDARYMLEQTELTCETNGYRDVAKEVYGLRLRLSETLRRLELSRPADTKGDEK